MHRITPRLARRVVDLALVALVGTVGLVAIIGIVAPLAGYRPFVIRGASMESAIPRGSLVIDAQEVGPTVRVGDVVSYREANGTIVTHRVAAVVDAGTDELLTTKGDANPAADPAAIPVGHVIGRVVVSLPALGFVSAMLGMPSGILTIALLALALVIISWLIAEITATGCPACTAEALTAEGLTAEGLTAAPSAAPPDTVPARDTIETLA